MKTKLSSVEFYFYTCLAFLITAVILLFPADCLSFALKGLNLWFERMIPTLFPFMVLSGVIIRMDLTDAFVKMLNPILGGLFRIRPACVYGMLVGFLCGFPMALMWRPSFMSKDRFQKRKRLIFFPSATISALFTF